MLKTTFISRASDGLILCETYEAQSDNQVERLKVNARNLLRDSKTFRADNVCSTVDCEDQKFQ